MQQLRFPILLLLLLLSACGDTTYHSQLKLLYSHSVPTISADSLAGLLEESGSVAQYTGTPTAGAPAAGKPASGTPAAIILLDTREQQEWQLSHIPGAKWAGFENFTLNLPSMAGKDTPIVLYCTIGYRSEQIGEQLMEAGYRNVSHLFGGIIGWKNNLYPVLNKNARTTDSLHTYDRYWAMFLKKGIPIYE